MRATLLSVLRWLPASCGTFERIVTGTSSNRRSLVDAQSTRRDVLGQIGPVTGDKGRRVQ
jgi:hypothetical protein